jgi:heptosyltransferase-3
MTQIPTDIRQILVGTGSGFGNVLLATPLIRTLRKAYPDATIDVLTLRGRSAILAGNPDINEIIEVGRREGLRATWQHLRRIARRYDISISAQSGDRWVFNACLAAPYSISHLLPRKGVKWWQRHLLSDHLFTDIDTTHVVLNCLDLTAPLNIPYHYAVVPPIPISPTAYLPTLTEGGRKFAVIHLFPRNQYKCWSTSGWQTLIQHLLDRNMRIAVTGGNDPIEQDYIKSVLAPFSEASVLNLAGKLCFQEVTGLLKEAAFYVGVDTAITHLAAATGIPVTAIYSPANPIIYWGPWPVDYADDKSPYAPSGTQQVGNITLIQTRDSCAGCSDDCLANPTQPCPCLQKLPPEDVIPCLPSAV